MITAIPIAILSMDSYSAFRNPGVGIEAMLGPLFWVTTALLWELAFEVAIVFDIRGKKEIASGIWAGVAVGAIPLGMSSFVMLQALQSKM